MIESGYSSALFDPPGCRRTLSGRASTAAHEAAVAAGEVFDHTLVTARIRACYGTWRDAQGQPMWISRNDLIDMVDRWYSAAAQPFERGNFTVTTDVRTISSRMAKLYWVAREANQHAGRTFDPDTMRFAGGEDSTSDKSRGTAAKLWEDVGEGHPLTCDFLDLYVGFILPVAQANGQIRDSVQGLLAVNALTKSIRTAYRDRFKGAGGSAINGEIFRHLQSPQDFEELLIDPMACVDRDCVTQPFVESVMRLVVTLREKWDEESQRAAGQIEDRLAEIGLDRLAPHPSQLLSAAVLANIRVKWTRSGTIPLAGLVEDPTARAIAARRLGAVGLTAVPLAISAALEAARDIIERELADVIRESDTSTLQESISPQDLARIVGAWADQAKDVPSQRLPTTPEALLREERVMAFVGGPSGAGPDRSDAKAVPNDQPLPVTLVGILRAQLAARPDDPAASVIRAALAMAARQARGKHAAYDALLAAALADERAALRDRRAQAETADDQVALAQVDAADRALTKDAVRRTLKQAAKEYLDNEAELQARERGPWTPRAQRTDGQAKKND